MCRTIRRTACLALLLALAGCNSPVQHLDCSDPEIYDNPPYPCTTTGSS